MPNLTHARFDASVHDHPMESLLDAFDEPMVLVGTDYKIVATNEAYRQSFEQDVSVAGQHCFAVSHHYTVPCDEAGETCPLRNSAATGQPARVIHLHHSPRGEEHVDVETRPIRAPNGVITHFLEILRPAREASVHSREQGLVGRSRAFNHALELVRRVAPTRTPVLLLGESGTGKELAARAVHQAGHQAGGPFVPVDCSGLTETLFESELFGHEKGAFTGAVARKIGLVEAARGGTLFLDEVGDIPQPLQVKLLRLLETGIYRRVGGVEPQQADFRLVCATHRDLPAMVEEGEFRQDLYYRISAFPIELPPLRERPEDLPVLVQTWLKRLSPERDLTLEPAAYDCLMTYGFPGNVRELRNILERAVVLADGHTIGVEHLPQHCRCGESAPPLFNTEAIIPLDQVETRYLQWANAHFEGDKEALAKALGISPRTLYRKLQRNRAAG